MMPIFFHAESHLWIAYLFFVNGFLINLLLRSSSAGYAELTKPLEAQVCAAFFISISINGVMLYGFDQLNLNFTRAGGFLLFVTTLLVLISGLRFFRSRLLSPFDFEFGVLRLSLYAFVFAVLFYNGALIELLTDAWWHMSLASKIASNNTFGLGFSHLTGLDGRYYPPLWHGNLALAHLVSGESIVVLWNSFTAWGAVLKVMGFYLLALSLSKEQVIAVLSAVLFVLLPGIAGSYLRVSAWPSHIGYAAFFSVFYVVFAILDSEKISSKNENIGLRNILLVLFHERSKLISILVLLVIILFSHQAELVWFLSAFLFYWIGLSAVAVFKNSIVEKSEPAYGLVSLFGLVLLFSIFFTSCWFIWSSWPRVSSNIDLVISYCLPALVMLVFLYIQLIMRRPESRLAIKIYGKAATQLSLLLLAITLLYSVDLRHLLSLFNYELAYPKGVSNASFLLAPGWFGENLAIPGWHLQLREGLLYSGVVSLPLSLLLVIYKPSRLTIFLASTGIFAFLFCSSPYLYQWLKDILHYHSPWRIGILIFHPIVIATASYFAWQFVFEHKRFDNA